MAQVALVATEVRIRAKAAIQLHQYQKFNIKTKDNHFRFPQKLKREGKP